MMKWKLLEILIYTLSDQYFMPENISFQILVGFQTF